MGMRGDSDMPMSEGANIELLEKIVADQRQILKEQSIRISKVPKVWALYKEVQTYYEKGMRVPDDVTLLWCDDNWGNIRRLPTPEERNRPAAPAFTITSTMSADPRSYKWLNTYSITKVWEQMNLALEYGADRIWVVNVGDLKPMEFPIEFFLGMARSPQRWGKDHLEEFTRLWAAREFGEHAVEIANGSRIHTIQRAPQAGTIEANTFSLTNYNEADRIERMELSLGERGRTGHRIATGRTCFVLRIGAVPGRCLRERKRDVHRGGAKCPLRASGASEREHYAARAEHCLQKTQS